MSIGSAERPVTVSAVIDPIAPAAHHRPARMPNSDATSVTATMNASPSVTDGTVAKMRAAQAPVTSAPAATSTEARPAPAP